MLQELRGMLGDLGRATEFELCFNAGAVGLDRFYADVECTRNLPAAATLADQFKDLQLAITQLVRFRAWCEG